jgi:hypothetical protein
MPMTFFRLRERYCSAAPRFWGPRLFLWRVDKPRTLEPGVRATRLEALVVPGTVFFRLHLRSAGSQFVVFRQTFLEARVWNLES